MSEQKVFHKINSFRKFGLTLTGGERTRMKLKTYSISFLGVGGVEGLFHANE